MLGEESQVDILIEFLAQAQKPSSIQDLHIVPTGPACPTTLTILNSSRSNRIERFPAQTTMLGEGKVTFITTADIARAQQLTAEVIIGKNVEGESLIYYKTEVMGISRISGGYEYSGALLSARCHIRPAHLIFSQCVMSNDVKTWNNWSASLAHGVSLKGLNLREANLHSYDLCCADLTNCDLRNCNFTGANLSGANLDGSLLEGAVFDGADLFGSAIPVKYENIMQTSGLLEKESIVLIS